MCSNLVEVTHALNNVLVPKCDNSIAHFVSNATTRMAARNLKLDQEDLERSETVAKAPGRQHAPDGPPAKRPNKGMAPLQRFHQLCTHRQKSQGLHRKWVSTGFWAEVRGEWESSAVDAPDVALAYRMSAESKALARAGKLVQKAIAIQAPDIPERLPSSDILPLADNQPTHPTQQT